MGGEVMQLSRRSVVSALPASVALLAFRPATASGTVVKVSLWDKGEASMDAMEMPPMGMAMAGADMAKATMGITVELAEIPAGEVTFTVTNESQEFYHSLSIAPVADVATELPYLSDKMMVDEAAAGTVARGKELRPHASGSVTVELQPGTYILFCNVGGHYVMGMWTLITVTE
jgi:uncharacterized cupredoxin-like copper-binding protein